MKLEAMALEFANDVRDKYRIGPPREKLPKGRRGDACECTLARAIGAGCKVTSGEVYLYAGDPDTEEHVIDLPPKLHTFVRWFDNGFYPELVVPA